MTLEILTPTTAIEYPVSSDNFPQAQWHPADISIILAAARGRGVSSGGAVSQRGAGANQSVDVTAATVVIDDVEHTFVGGNVGAPAAHATLPRFDLVVVDDAGACSVVSCTAASVPTMLDGDIPSDSVVLAQLFRRPADNVIADAEIVDKRGDVRSPLADSAWTTVTAISDEPKTNDTTLANDAELTFAMAANTDYAIRGRIWIDAAATPDWKYAFVGPASPTLVRFHREDGTGSAASAPRAVDTGYPGSTAQASSTANGGYLAFDAIVHNGANAGTFAFQWAQNTLDAGTVTRRKGSYVEYVAN